MCLSVYLGCHEPLQLDEVQEGSLGAETASWTPPPLAEFPFVYYLGRKGKEGALECSCLLAQHVDWNERGPTVCFDELYYKASNCPFEALKGYVQAALSSGNPVMLACDDTGGAASDCSSEDYDHLIINTDMISSDSYLFADPISSFPWRAFYIADQGRS